MQLKRFKFTGKNIFKLKLKLIKVKQKFNHKDKCSIINGLRKKNYINLILSITHFELQIKFNIVSRVSTLATNVAKSPSFNNNYEYIGKTPLLNTPSECLSPKLRSYIEECASLCCPKDIYICDGSDIEYDHLLKLMEKMGTISPLTKYENWQMYLNNNFIIIE